MKKKSNGTSRMSKILEEKHVGSETLDWTKVKDFDKAFRENLRHYSYFYDVKDSYSWFLQWVEENQKSDIKWAKALDIKDMSMTLGSMCKMLINGAVFTEDQNNRFIDKVKTTIEAGKKSFSEKKEDVSENTIKRNPAEILRDKTNSLIADIESVIDDWQNQDKFSLYDELKKVDAAQSTASRIFDYYSPLLEELSILINKKDDDVVESYRNMSVREQKKFYSFVENMLNDVDKYIGKKRAVRKPRKKKVKRIEDQISKLQYMKECDEFKIASVDPAKIVGASEVLLFNVRYRTLSRLVPEDGKAFEIKGTTILNIDDAKSYKKTIRKPDEFFTLASNTTKIKLKKTLEALKTKESKTTGRVNSDTIIYKVYQ